MTSLPDLARKSPLLFFSALLTLQACLPGTPSEPKLLFPADSLSRSIAEQLPIEGLILEWEKTSEVEGFGHLSSLRFAGDQIYAADIEKGQLLKFDASGDSLDSNFENLHYPYLLEVYQESLTVFNAGAQSIDWYEKGKHVRSVKLPDTEEEKSLSYFPTTFQGKVYMKTQPSNG